MATAHAHAADLLGYYAVLSLALDATADDIGKRGVNVAKLKLCAASTHHPPIGWGRVRLLGKGRSVVDDVEQRGFGVFAVSSQSRS